MGRETARHYEPVNAITQFLEVTPRGRLPHPRRVFSAGDNAGRREWLKMCFPKEKCEVLQYDFNKEIGVDSEPRHPNEVEVMQHKLSVAFGGYNLMPRNIVPTGEYAASFNSQDTRVYNPQYNDGGDLIVAVDSRTYIPKGGETAESMGKPRSLEEIKKNFESMLEITVNGASPEYDVKNATGVVYVDKNLSPYYSTKQNTCKIFLNKGRLAYITTDDGFKEYIQKANEFFGEEQEIMNKSAGFSLEVLVQMGAVSGLKFPDEEISQRESLAFRNTLKRAIQHVMFGTSPEIMELFEGVDATSVINTWDLLENDTARALGEK